MGSFLVSCGLSKMPIHEEENVKILFLVESVEFNSIGSGKNYKAVFPFFVDGVYKDYGNFEIRADEIVTNYMENYFKEKLVPTYNNRYSNESAFLDKESFKIHDIFNYIHDDLLYLKPNIMYAFQRSKFSGVYADITSERPLKVQCMAIKTSILERLFDGVYDPYGTYIPSPEEYGDENFGAVKSLSFDEMREKFKGNADDDDAIAYAICKAVFNTGRRENPVESLIDSDGIEKIKEYVKEDNLLVTIIVSETISKEISSSNTMKYVKSLINDDNRDALTKLCVYSNITNMSPSEVRGCYEYKNDGMYSIAPFMDIDSMVDFFVFDSWLGLVYHGCYTPTAYSGQETSTYAHSGLASIILDVCEEESYDEDEEDDV